MPNEEVAVVTQSEENPISTREMLIEALENANAEEPTNEAPTEAPVEAPANSGMDVSEFAHGGMATAETPNYATKEDIVSAINNAMANMPAREPEKPVVEAEVTVETTEPELEFDQEQFMDAFYDDPSLAIKNTVLPLAEKIADKKVKEVVSGIENKLKPLLSQSEAAQYKDDVRSAISEFLNNTDDARDYFQDMTSYIKANNLDPKSNQSYLDAYRISKINRLGNENAQLRASQGKGLDDYLADENSLSEIARNELVKQRVIDEYLKGLDNGNKPRTIGIGGSNNPSAQPVNRATTMRDAKAMLIDQLSK